MFRRPAPFIEWNTLHRRRHVVVWLPSTAGDESHWTSERCPIFINGFFFNKVRVRRGAKEEKMKETGNTEGEMKRWGMGLGARKVKSAPVSLSFLL